MPDRTDEPATGPSDGDRRCRGWSVGDVALAGALALVLGLVVAVAVACSGDGGSGAATTTAGTTPSGRTPLAGFGEVAATVRNSRSSEATGPSVVETLCLLLASTAEQREQGLMHVTDASLGGHDGMLFSFPADVDGSFWMRDTPMPLSIAFFDAGGQLVSTTDMAPCGDSSSCPTYAAGGSYRYALEVPKGRLPDVGVAEGATLRVGGECAPAAG